MSTQAARWSAGRKAKRLEEQNGPLRRNSFGSKGHSSGKRESGKDGDNDIPNREEGKEGSDGTGKSLPTTCVSEKEGRKGDAVSKSERDPVNRPETYRTCGSMELLPSIIRTCPKFPDVSLQER